MKGGYSIKILLISPFLLGHTLILAQQKGTPERLSPADFHFPGDVGRTYLESDPAQSFAAKSSLAKGKHTVVINFVYDGNGVGMDIGSAVDFTYKLPFTFTGKIEKVVVDLK